MPSELNDRAVRGTRVRGRLTVKCLDLNLTVRLIRIV